MPLINSTEEGNIIMWMLGAFENFSFHWRVIRVKNLNRSCHKEET